MSSRLRLLIVSVVLFAAALACSTSPDLKQFNSVEGRFSVMFPGDPKTTTQTVPTAVGDITLTMYTASTSDGAYFVGYADYPADAVASSDPQNMLDGARDGALKNVNGTLISEEKITLDGNPGRSLQFKSSDGKNVAYGHIYLIDNRLYQILVVSAPGKLTQDQIDAFLNSFSLTQ